MKYVRYTYVDAKTGVSCLVAPTRNGPMHPTVSGLTFVFALESNYPTAYPTFFGTCDDTADTGISGITAVLSENEYNAAMLEEMNIRRANLHIRRRERRTQAETAGFIYRDRVIDSDRDSVQRIAQATGAAGQSVFFGVLYSVSWTCADDSDLILDAEGVLGLQAALAAHGAACHERSRILKGLINEASNFAELAEAAAEISIGWPEATP